MKRIALLLILAAFAANAADSTAVGTSRDEHRARMTKAIEARDYEAWKAEREAWGAKGQAGQKVTKENFETFARLHEAVQAGRDDEAAALRSQLGMGPGAGMGPRAGMGPGAGMGQGKGRMAGMRGPGEGRGQGMGRGAGAGSGQGCARKD